MKGPAGRKPRAVPPDPATSERMRRVKTEATGPEMRARRAARKLGIRYSTKTSGLPGSPDVLLVDARVAVFVNGCFWHGCPRCFKPPKRNRAWWVDKVARNRRRDRRKSDQLRRLGYSVVTLMEHDDDARMRSRLAAAGRRVV